MLIMRKAHHVQNYSGYGCENYVRGGGMDLDQISNFCAIVEQGNFTRAASLMHLSQSAISRQMQALESKLGCQLFDRSIKSAVVLTAEGELFLRFARSIIAQRTSLCESLDDFARNRKGRVRITCAETLAQIVLPRYVSKYCKENPDVDVRVFSLNPGEALDLLWGGEVDMSVIMGSMAQPGMEAMLWREGRYMLMVPKGHPLTRETAVTLEAVNRYRIMLPHKRGGISARYLFEGKLAEYGMQPNICLESDIVPLKADYVRIGFGICFLLTVAETRQLYPGELDFIPMDHIFPPNNVVICIRSQTALSEPARDFLNCLLVNPNPK